MESVTLKASGYGWNCPNCCADNHITYLPEDMIVQCEECGEEYIALNIDTYE